MINKSKYFKIFYRQRRQFGFEEFYICIFYLFVYLESVFYRFLFTFFGLTFTRIDRIENLNLFYF